MLRITLSRLGASEHVIELRDRTLRIGRGAGNEVLLKDPDKTVSRTHGEVRREAVGWVFIDNDSQNGSWIEGRRVDRVVLRDGVSVSFGDYELSCQGVDGPEDAAKPTAAVPAIGAEEETQLARDVLARATAPATVAAPPPAPRSASGGAARPAPSDDTPPAPPPARKAPTSGMDLADLPTVFVPPGTSVSSLDADEDAKTIVVPGLGGPPVGEAAADEATLVAPPTALPPFEVEPAPPVAPPAWFEPTPGVLSSSSVSERPTSLSGQVPVFPIEPGPDAEVTMPVPGDLSELFREQPPSRQPSPASLAATGPLPLQQPPTPTSAEEEDVATLLIPGRPATGQQWASPAQPSGQWAEPPQTRAVTPLPFAPPLEGPATSAAAPVAATPPTSTPVPSRAPTAQAPVVPPPLGTPPAQRPPTAVPFQVPVPPPVSSVATPAPPNVPTWPGLPPVDLPPVPAAASAAHETPSAPAPPSAVTAPPLPPPAAAAPAVPPRAAAQVPASRPSSSVNTAVIVWAIAFLVLIGLIAAAGWLALSWRSGSEADAVASTSPEAAGQVGEAASTPIAPPAGGETSPDQPAAASTGEPASPAEPAPAPVDVSPPPPAVENTGPPSPSPPQPPASPEDRAGARTPAGAVSRLPNERPAEYRERLAALERQYASGRDALASGRAVAARDLLRSVAAAAPTYKDVDGLLRDAEAAVAREGAAALASAEKLEQARDYEKALAAYRRAEQMDAPAAEVSAGTQRVQQAMRADGEKAYTEARQYDGLGRNAEAIARYEVAVRYLPEGDPRRTQARQRLEALAARRP